MKTKELVLPVLPDNARTIKDPAGKGHDTTLCFIQAKDLPDSLPMEVNPRTQDTRSRVSRSIREGFTEWGDVFHILNRGLALTALSSRIDTKKGAIVCTLAGDNYGLIDGGHTFRVVTETIKGIRETDPQNPLLQQFVKLEIVTGVKGDLITELAKARNTSAQVHAESLANLEGSFDILKETFKNERFGNRIAYRENEDDSLFPIDVREVIALLTMFHPSFEDSENPPVMAYTSKGRCLELFRAEPEGYETLMGIAAEILRLYDYVHSLFPDFYESLGGFTGVCEEEKGRKTTSGSVKLAKVNEVTHIPEGYDLEYLEKMVYYQIPDGWLFPIVAALRGLVKHGKKASWSTPPAEFFDRFGKGLVKLTLQQAKQSGRAPNVVGKNRNHWIQLHERVLLKLK